MSAAAAHLTDAELGDLVDGALGGAAGAAAEAHLAGCAACRGALDDARALRVASRALGGGVSAPPELWPLVAAATVYARPVRRRVLRELRGPLLAGALALVFGTAAVTALVAARLRPAPAPARTPVGVAVPTAPVPPAPPRPPTPPAPP